MEYAFHNGLRTSAQPGLKGVCPHCETDLLAKCGSKKIWHWAHTARENCDPWLEAETQWHRSWKKLFGEKYSEIRVVKGETYHIADVLNQEGIVFEFQNSPISSETIQAREKFYGERMIWVLNGISFKNNFQITDHDFIKDWQFIVEDEFETARNYKTFSNGLVIESWRVKLDAVKLFLKAEGFEYIADSKLYYLPLNIGRNRDLFVEKLYAELKELYQQQISPEGLKKGVFEWEHARNSWEECERPVFIDFGDELLYKINSNMGRKNGEGVKVSKKLFLEKYTKS